MALSALLYLVAVVCVLKAGHAADPVTDDQVLATWTLLNADDGDEGDDGIGLDTMKKLCKDAMAILQPSTPADVIEQQCVPDVVEGMFQAISQGGDRVFKDAYVTFVKNYFNAPAAPPPPPPMPSDAGDPAPPPQPPPAVEEASPVVEQSAPVEPAASE